MRWLINRIREVFIGETQPETAPPQPADAPVMERIIHFNDLEETYNFMLEWFNLFVEEKKRIDHIVEDRNLAPMRNNAIMADLTMLNLKTMQMVVTGQLAQMSAIGFIQNFVAIMAADREQAIKAREAAMAKAIAEQAAKSGPGQQQGKIIIPELRFGGHR